MTSRALDTKVALGDGRVIPALGLGTYKSLAGEVEDAVAFALRAGYRSIDTASFYGNEEGVAAGIAGSGVARDEIFLTTKVWNDEQGFDGTRAALERSLARLGTDHVDLYLVHWPVRQLLEPTWRAMEELRRSGMARSIGVCNFLPHQLDALLAFADIPPVVDQVEFHPWLQQPELQRYLAERGIVLEAWAPLMRGRAAEEPALVGAAAAHGVTPSQAALRWALQLGHVVIPKSVHAERITENASVDGFELTEAEMASIAAADRGLRMGPDPDAFVW